MFDTIHCVKLLSEHFETNFKNLFGKDFATDVIFLVFLSVNNDLIIYIFATGLACEITYVGSTELNNVLYITVKNLNAQNNYLDDQCFRREQISNLKRP